MTSRSVPLVMDAEAGIKPDASIVASDLSLPSIDLKNVSSGIGAGG